MPVVLEVNDVKKHYGDVEAVKGVSFKVDRGEFFGLLGPNGAGKTTLMRMITGILPPDEGEIRVMGLNLWDNLSKLKRVIGYVPQEHAFYEELTGYENLMFYAGLYRLSRAEARRRIKEIVDMVGLSEQIGRKVKTYSGGMKKRLNIAIALIHDPQILVLDEPTTGLDPNIRRDIWDFMRGLVEMGKTIVMATHYMEEAEELCGRVAVMDDGRLVALGAPEELKKSLNLRSVIEVEVRGDATQILSRYSQGGVVLEKDGVYRVYSLDPQSDVPKIVNALSEEGLRIVRISVEEPTLEDVFLKLTGKRLTEGG